jgi:hypothetical protein
MLAQSHINTPSTCLCAVTTEKVDKSLCWLGSDTQTRKPEAGRPSERGEGLEIGLRI